MKKSILYILSLTAALLLLTSSAPVRADEVPDGEAALSVPAAAEGDAEPAAASAAAETTEGGQLPAPYGDEPWDITGNGLVDGSDEVLFSLWKDGLLEDPDAIAPLMQNSLLGENYFDLFSYTGTEQGDDYFRNALVSVIIDHGELELEYKPGRYKTAIYYLADIYVRDLKCFRTALADPGFRKWAARPVTEMAKENNAVIAVSGDYCSGRSTGLACRDGVWYRESVDQDREACVLYMDGTMETYRPSEIDINAIKERGAWQAWNFGPGLLDENGDPKTSFLTDVFGKNPRSAIGYFEPGHYCLLLVEGRGVNGSDGMNMEELADFFSSLGCTAAYNFDGGATAIMANAAGAVSTQSKSRECSDIVFVAAEPMSIG